MLQEWSILAGRVPVEIWLKWALVLGGMFAALFYMLYEQRKFLRYHQRLASHASSRDTSLIEYSIQLLALSTRNRTLFSISIILLAMSVVFYDAKQLTLANTPPPAAEAEEATAEAPAAPRVVVAAPEPVPTESPATEAALDQVKQIYEQAYVHYFVLARCGKARPGSLALINSALLMELEGGSIPPAFARHVREAAKGTYQELYASSPCEGPAFEGMQQAHERYLQQVREGLDARFKI